MDIKLFVPKRIYDNPAVDANMLAAYTLLLPINSIPFSSIYINQESLLYPWFGADGISHYRTQNIMKGLKNLITKGIVQGKVLTNNSFTIDPASLRIQNKELFSIVYSPDVATLISQGHNKELRYLCQLISTIDRNYILKDVSNFLGFQALSTIAAISKCSVATVIKYNKVLEKNKIIYFKRQYKQNNIYGYYRYKSLIAQAIINIDYD